MREFNSVREKCGMIGQGAKDAFNYERGNDNSPNKEFQRANSREKRSLQRNLHSDLTQMMRENEAQLNQDQNQKIKKIESKLFNLRLETESVRS